MTTVVITGATGSIGRKLRAHMETLGWELRLLCLNPGADPAVTTVDLTVWDDGWARACGGADAVIHLAGDPSPTASWESVQRLNIDMTFNVARAARSFGARRMVFASSNWVMAGYRFGDETLTTDLPPRPLNPYGMSKLVGERIGRAAVAEGLASFVALRIGWCQHTEGNRPGPHMAMGRWGQQMWLSDRDLCAAMTCAVRSDHRGFAVLNLTSGNTDGRWDLAATAATIGYVPADGHTAVLSDQQVRDEMVARRSRALAADLEANVMLSGW